MFEGSIGAGMSHELLIEDSPFGTRTLLRVDGAYTKMMHHFPSRRSASFGELFWVRTGKRDNRLGAQVCDMGAAGEGLLPVRDRAYPEGQLILTVVRREAIGAKRPVISDRPSLRLPAATIPAEGDVRPGPLGIVKPPARLKEFASQQAEEPSRLDLIPSAVRQVALLAPSKLESVTCNSGLLASAMRPYLPDSVHVSTDGQIALAIDEAEEDALCRTIPLEGGGRLIIDEVEALTAIDLDIGTRTGQSGAGAASALFRDALKTLRQVISLKAIGGQVVLDVPRGAVRAPKMIRDQLTALFKGEGLTGVPAVTKEGLVVLIFGQNQMPTRSVLTELADAETWLEPGRRLSADVMAWRAHTRAAQQLRDDPSGQVAVSLPGDVFTCWENNDATEALADIYGKRLTVTRQDDEGAN